MYKATSSSSKQKKSVNLPAIYEHAIKLFNERSYRVSIEKFSRFIELVRESELNSPGAIEQPQKVIADAEFMLGQNYYGLENWLEAEICYKKALILDQTASDVLGCLYNCWSKLFDNKQIFAELKKLLTEITNPKLRSEIYSVLVNMACNDLINLETVELEQYCSNAKEFFPVVYLLLGNYLLQKGLVQEAIKAYLAAIKYGEPRGYCNLAIIYRSNDYGYKNIKLASIMSEKAAKAGLVTEMYNLAVMYDHGINVSRDCIKAREWYEQAIKKGHGIAAKNLALMFRDNELSNDVADNLKQAFQLFGQAVVLLKAEDNSEFKTYAEYQKIKNEALSDSLYELGKCYENGYGTVINNNERDKYYREASALENIFAKAALGRIAYMRGNIATAKKYWQECAASHAASAFNLAILLEAEGDLEQAKLLYFQAAEAGVYDGYINWLGIHTKQLLLKEKYNIREELKVVAEILERTLPHLGSEFIPQFNNINVKEELLAFLKNLLRLKKTTCVQENKTIIEIYNEKNGSPLEKIRIIIRLAKNTLSDSINLATAIHRIGHLYQEHLASYKNNASLYLLLPEIFDLVRMVIKKFDQLSHGGLCNIIEGLARLREAPDQENFSELIGTVYHEVIRRINILDNTNCLTLLFHTAVSFGLSHPVIVDAVTQLARKALAQVNVDNVSDNIQLLYSLAVLDNHKNILEARAYPVVFDDVSSLLSMITAAVMRDIIPTLEKKHECYLALYYFSKVTKDETIMPALKKLSTDLQPWFLAHKAKITELQKTVTKQLMKYFPELEVEKLINGLPVDVYLLKEKAIVSVNGPLHYLHKQEKDKSHYESTAKDLFHDALLQPYKIISISFTEISSLKTDEEWYEFFKTKFAAFSIEIIDFSERWTFAGNRFALMNSAAAAQPPATASPTISAKAELK